MLAVGETKFFGEPVAAVAAEDRGCGEGRGGGRAGRVRRAARGADRRAGPRSASPLVQDPCDSGREGSARTRTCCSEWTFGWGDVGVGADLRHRARLHVPDGHALRDRAARLPRGARRERRHDLERRRSIPTCCSASSPPRWDGRSRGSASSRPIPAAGSAAKAGRSSSRCWRFSRCGLGRPVRLVLTLEETFQQARRTSARIHARTGFDATGGSSPRNSTRIS